MADDMQHGMTAGGMDGVDMLSQHGLHSAAATEYAEAEVNEDILQQALAEASANNNFYHDTLNSNNNAPADSSLNSEMYSAVPDQAADGAGGSLLLAAQHGAPAAAEMGAPLGSRANPIRIIQQGNQYTSMQHLMPDQLSQIMQVLQQQQVARGVGGSTVMLQSDGNARVVYRIIYPNDASRPAQPQSAGSSSEIAASAATAGAAGVVRAGQLRAAARKGRRKRKRTAADEWEEASDGEWVAAESGSDESRMAAAGVDGAEALSREEKEERKKHRPRTRSGRVSKPPKHMVKDYKHIHPLDWDEDYDDSDGGYSDFKHSGGDEEDGDSKDSMDASVYSDSRKKVWKCRSCNKSYIGTGGLGRHYRLYPSHGSLSDLMSQSTTLFADGTATPLFLQAGQGIQAELSQDSLSRDTSVSADGMMAGLPSDVAVVHSSPHFATPTLLAVEGGPGTRPATAAYLQQSQSARKITKTPGYIPTGRPRGRPPSNPAELAERRRLRLRDLVQQCNQEDLIEIVLPLLLPTVSSWEFLLMRCEEASRLAVADELQQPRRSVGSRQPATGGGRLLHEVLREFDDVRCRAAAAVKGCIEQQQAVQQQHEAAAAGSSDSEAAGAAAASGVTLRIEDEAMARALDLDVGVYDAASDLREQSRLRQPPSSMAFNAAGATGQSAGRRLAEVDTGSGSTGAPLISTPLAVSSPMTSATSLLRDRSIPMQSAASTNIRSAAPVSQHHHHHASSAAATAAAAALQHHSLVQQSLPSHGLQQQPAAPTHALLSQQQQQASTAADIAHHLGSDAGGNHHGLDVGDSQKLHVFSDANGTLTLSRVDAGDGTATLSESVEGLTDGTMTVAAGMDSPMYTMTAGGELIAADGSIVQLPEGTSVIQTSEGIVIYHPSVDAASTSSGAMQFEGGQTVPLESLQGLMLAVDADGNAQLHYVGDQGRMQ